MARIRDYLQDDEKPFGVGTFVLDDGSEYYLDDPERARDFLSEYERESTNIAERGSPDRQGEELDGRQKYENAATKLAGMPEPNQPFRGIDSGPSSLARAVAGPGGGEDDTRDLMQRGRDTSGNRDLVMRSGDDPGRVEPLSSEPEDNMSRMPEPERPPPSPAELAEAEAGRRWQSADAAVSRVTGGTNPRALGPGVRVDKNYSRKGGLPMAEYDQQSQGRAMAYQGGNELAAQHFREDEAANNLAAVRLESEALAQKKSNAEQALALQRKEQKYSEDRQWLEKDVDSFYDKAKPDANRLFKERGVFGNIVQAIAQFMGAYASVISGSPNFANQILDRKIERDVGDQMEDFRRGKMKRDGQLARMAERGMSVDQMKSALRLQQELVVQKEVKAAALREGTRESKQAAESLLMERQERFINEENKFRTEALGEETVSGEMVRPTGPRAKTPLELAKERNALLGAQVEGEFLARGGAPAERAEERDMKREETGVKREADSERRRAEYGNKRGSIAAPAKEAQDALDTIERIQKRHGGALPGVGLLDIGRSDKARKAGTVVGNEYMKDAGELRTAVNVMRDASLRAAAGTQTEGDVKRVSESIAGEDLSEEQLLKGVRRLAELAQLPLTELDATYSDVKGRQDEQRDRAKYEAYLKRKEAEERKRRGVDY